MLRELAPPHWGQSPAWSPTAAMATAKMFVQIFVMDFLALGLVACFFSWFQI